MELDSNVLVGVTKALNEILNDEGDTGVVIVIIKAGKIGGTCSNLDSENTLQALTEARDAVELLVENEGIPTTKH